MSSIQSPLLKGYLKLSDQLNYPNYYLQSLILAKSVPMIIIL